MAPKLPGPDSRWRCSHCGNLTRFDVTRTRTTVEFWHVSLSGDPDVEETELLDEAIEKVICRWCGAADAVEVVVKPENPEDIGDEAGLGGTP